MHVSRDGLRDFALGFVMFLVGLIAAAIVLAVSLLLLITR
jgi:hypothetical protein